MILLVVCLGQLPSLADVRDYEGKPVGAISFDPKQQPMTGLELADLVGIKKNDALRMSAVREAIGRLYATGRYADIAVDATLEEGRVNLRFLTKSNWFVGDVTSNRVPVPPSLGQLLNAAGLSPGSPLFPEDLKQAVQRMQGVLASNGYFHSKIDEKVTHHERTQQADVQFHVEPGTRSRIGPPVITGDPKLPTAVLIKRTGWKGWFGWHPLTDSRIQRGLDRILQYYRDRNFLMARVTLEKIDPASGSPVVEVNAGPEVVVTATGAKVSRGRLRRLLPVFEERTVDRDLLVEGASDLTEYFQTRGYFDAKVEFRSSTGAGGRMEINYSIDRGERHRLAELIIQGNRYFNTATLRERMFIAPASIQVRRGRYSATLLDRDLESLAELYRSNGFRDVKVTSRILDDYHGRKGDLAVQVDIAEGAQWIVAGLEIEGAGKENEAALRGMLQSVPGQPFSDANVATDRDNILAYYFNRGYPAATFEWSYLPTPVAHRVELHFRIAEGARLFVREVLISGLRTTRPQLVNKRIGINVADSLSQAQMLDTQRRLYDLGIFAKVDVAAQNPDGQERDKFVLLQVEESRKYSIATGFGAEIARIGGSQTSLDSPAGTAGFSPRVSFDFSRVNFLGLAHTVSLRSRVSNLQQRALLSYTAPQIKGRQNVDLTFTALFDSSRDVRTFSARRWEGSSQLAHRWTRSKTLFYRFAYRRVSVDQATLKIRPELIPLLAQPVRVGVISAAYVDDRRDDPTDSHRGTFNSLDIGTASKFLFSQTDYFRLLGRNSTYHRIGPKLVLARTVSFGFMQTLRKPPDLPPSPQDIPLPERFFSGGASTLRAFPENQAGPRDLVTGFPLGGKALLIFGTELRFPLYGQNISAVLFHDAGNVYSSLQDISFRAHQRDKTDFNYMVHAAGLGFRYRTPIGPVRVDFSFSPNSPRFSGCRGTLQELLFGACVVTDQRINRFQFHFSLGQTF